MSLRTLSRLGRPVASLAAAAVLPLTIPGALAAQTVLGRVVDSATHRPVAGLAVRLVAVLDSARDTVVARTQTAPDGAFLVEAPRPGTYRVRLGEAHLGPPLTLATADAEDQHQYVIGAAPPPGSPPDAASGPSRFHVLHGAELDSALRTDAPLLACEVDRHAAFVPGKVSMQFPFDLRDRAPTGSVLAEFVVDTLARLEPSTLRITRSPETDAAFAKSVEAGLRRSRFYAAVADGRRVRQRMYVPVTFQWGDAAAPPVLHGSPCGPAGDAEPVVVTARPAGLRVR